MHLEYKKAKSVIMQMILYLQSPTCHIVQT